MLAVLTLAVYSVLWMKQWYYVLLSFLGIVSLIVGISILRFFRTNNRSIILIVLGLVVGQWWFVELIFIQIIWQVKGFSP